MDWKDVDIASSIAIITSLIAIWRAYRMTPHEESASDANAAKSYAEAAEKANDRANALSSKVGELEGRIDKLVSEDRELRRDNREYLEILANWAEGIELLMLQIRANQLSAAWMPQQETIDRFKKERKKK